MISLLPVPEVERVMRDARDSISSYCIDTCKGKCCLGGMLIAKSEKEIRTWLKLDGKINLEEFSYMHPHRLEKHKSFYIVHFPCNQFKDRRCDIHEEPSRPYQCKVYPIQLKRRLVDSEIKEVVEYTTQCDAVQMGLLNDYIKKIEKLGYSIEKFPKL